MMMIMMLFFSVDTGEEELEQWFFWFSRSLNNNNSLCVLSFHVKYMLYKREGWLLGAYDDDVTKYFEYFWE